MVLKELLRGTLCCWFCDVRDSAVGEVVGWKRSDESSE